MSDRAARLAALRTKAGKSSASAPPPLHDGPKQVTIKHRNYEPTEEDDNNAEADASDENSSSKRRKLEPEAESGSSLTAALKAAQTVVAPKTPSSNAIPAPAKVNWDLKRDCKSRLDKLERRTKRAIVGLLRERLAREEEVEGESSEGELD